MATKQSGSWFFQQLQRTTVRLNLRALTQHCLLTCLSPTALALFIRMLPYAAISGLPADFTLMARFGRTGRAAMKRHWRELEPFFRASDDGRHWWLRDDLDDLGIEIETEHRSPLRHLLERLVAFWGDVCVYCGEPSDSLNIEHIVPIARGGTNDIRNLTVSCPQCNNKKRTKTAAEFGFPHVHERAQRIQ